MGNPEPRGIEHSPDFTLITSFDNGTLRHGESDREELLPYQVLYNED